MLGGIEREGRDVIRFGEITNEAAGSMGVKANHEEESQVVGVPERFKALGANLLMRRRVHQNHDEEHEMPGDAARLSVMDVKRPFRANLCRR